MMQCPEADRIADYLNGDLPEDERRRITDHISDCDSCQRELESAKAFDTFLRRIEPLKAPAALYKNIMGRIKPVRRRTSVPDWLTALAIGLFLAFLGSLASKLNLSGLGESYSQLKVAEIIAQISTWFNNTTMISHEGWIGPINGISNILLLNLLVAGVVLFWGLWQMVRAMR